MKIIFLGIFCLVTSALHAQQWQQRVEYRMEIDFDVRVHRFAGIQQLVYHNHSPDTLTWVFYHLYFNAFQPGSAMDIWNRNSPDPDMRIEPIKTLLPDEQGYLKVNTLVQDGSQVTYFENGTILEVQLARPLYPGATTTLQMGFTGQVPKQTRRSGRDNAEGISYSMSQWYPKLCAYDQGGWHPNPYISREFYGDFGDFDVKISIDKKFIVAASGHLQNASDIGYGYEDSGVVVPEFRSDQITWHFVAKDVHDFVWAADPDYSHLRFERKDGTVVHYFYQETSYNAESWNRLPNIIDHAFDYINAQYGHYPYRTYSFIQGGDSGMEYPMATLITGNRSLHSLVGVAVHELIHSWYQSVLATNESLYAWMDEGFTNYAQAMTMQELAKRGLIPGETGTAPRFETDYGKYFQLVQLGIEEPMSTHGDHFATNTAYYSAAYSKGCIFLAQLEYIIGPKALQKVMLRYFNAWKFKHPRPEDFIRIAEKESGLVLDWYYEYWILSTKFIDYGIENVEASGTETKITLRRTGAIPMPLEINVKTKRGTDFRFYIPLDLMRGNKQFKEPDWTILEDWQWASQQYSFVIPLKYSQLATIEIDPSRSLADISRSDNTFGIPSDNE
ncbi:MAG TPA: M1 family metallopeptidase [Saprospiraceae bacterium]|nr:M1 family metallopeptidase [Saprospiraceae bacterium]